MENWNVTWELDSSFYAEIGKNFYGEAYWEKNNKFFLYEKLVI